MRRNSPTPLLFRLAVVVLMLSNSLFVLAQADTIPDRYEVTNAQMLSFGATEILDTYLSPEKYSGTEVRYISHTTRETPGKLWSRQIIHQANFADVSDRSGDGNEVSGLYTFSYAVHYNWQLMGGRLRLKAGGLTDLNLGVIYNTRNQNNPAQMRLSMMLAPSGVAIYDFRVKRLKCSARYEMSVPLAGVMFSPNYGQSYYEIFSRGNYDHNVVPVTVFSAPSLRHMLSLDVRWKKTTLRVGYLGDFQQADVNQIKQHVYTHAFILGVVRHFKTLHIR